VRELLTQETLAGEARLLNKYLKPDLLIIDDMGLKILPSKSGEILLEIIMRRYENRSTMMTSNRPMKNGANCLAMYPPPAPFSIACSTTPRLSLSPGAATDSRQTPSSLKPKSNRKLPKLTRWKDTKPN
jgi:hypothetical protein